MYFIYGDPNLEKTKHSQEHETIGQNTTEKKRRPDALFREPALNQFCLGFLQLCVLDQIINNVTSLVAGITPAAQGILDELEFFMQHETFSPSKP